MNNGKGCTLGSQEYTDVHKHIFYNMRKRVLSFTKKIVLSMDRNYINSCDGIKSLYLIDWLLS